MVHSSLSQKWTALTAGVLAFAVGAAAGVPGFSADGVHFVQAKAKTDLQGDPLPPGATARMGTLRWRHPDDVSFVAFAHDGKSVLTGTHDRVVTGTHDGLVRVWERSTGKPIREMNPTSVKGGLPATVSYVYRGLTRMALAPDGKIMATMVGSNVIQLWDVTTGKTLRRLSGPLGFITDLEFSPDGKLLAARGSNRITYVLETENGKVLHQIKGRPVQGAIRILGGGVSTSFGIAFSRDGKVLASAQMDYVNQKINTYITFTDIKTGKEIKMIDATPNGVFGVAFAPDGKTFAYGSNKGVHVVAADSGKEIHNIETPGQYLGLTYSPDSKLLAVKSRDTVIRLFDMRTGKRTHEFGEKPALVNGNVVAIANFSYGGASARDFAFSADGKTLAVSHGQLVRFFDVASGKEQAHNGGGHRGAVSAVTVSPDGKTLTSRALDGTIRRWNALTGQELGQFHEPAGTTGVVFSRDGKLAASANNDGTIRLHSVANGKEVHRFDGHKSGAASIAFSPNGKTLASRGSSDYTIRLFDVDKKTDLRRITLPGANPNGRVGVIIVGGRYVVASNDTIAFSPDGQTLAVNMNANSITIINGRRQQTASNAVHFFSVRTGKETGQLSLPPGRGATGLAFSPDGRLLATENADQSLTLWELASGRERAVLAGPAMPNQVGQTSSTIFLGGGGAAGYGRGPLATTTLAFSPDGSLVAARGPDHAVRVFDVAKAREAAKFKGHIGAVQSLAFAADGKSFATGSADTTILVWNLATAKRQPRAEIQLQAKELDALWADLVRADGVKAGKSINQLTLASKQAAAYFSERLKPAPPPDVQKIDKWIADLDSGNFKLRAIAARELEKLGELAAPALKQVLAGRPTLETRRRIEPMLEKLAAGVLTPEQLRTTRAIEVLENVGVGEARRVLESIAKGAPGALQTRQAQQALDRLNRLAASRPSK